MIPVSTTYDNIIANNSGHYEWRIVNNSKTIVSDLKRGNLTTTLFEQCSIGNVLAAQLDFEYYDDGTALDTSYPLVLSFRAVSGSSASEWITKGTYFIDTIERSPYSTVVKVTAFDALLKANVPWMVTGTFTATTDYAIARGIASDIGVNMDADTVLVEFADPIDITQAPSIGANGTTSLEMLSYIGVMHGGNWIINSNNELELVPLFSEQETGAASVNIGDAVTDFDASPVEPVVGVCIWNSDNNYFRVPNVTDEEWDELDGRIIDAKCFIGGTQELAQTLYNKFVGKNYYPYTTSRAWVDIKYELGDGITIKDVSSVICNQTINLTAVASSSLSAQSRDIVTSHYPVPTPVERQIARQEARTQASITVLEDSISLEASQRQLADDEEAAAREQSNSEFSQSISQLQVTTDNISSSVQALQDDNTQMQTTITQTANGLEVLSDQMETVSGYVNGQSAYLRWNGTTATLSIGSSTVTAHTEVRPTGFAVVNGGVDIFLATGDVISLPRGVLEVGTGQGAYAKVGRYKWIDEGSLGFSLMYVG